MTDRLKPLMPLVREYQDALDLDAKIQAGEDLVRRLVPELRAFLFHRQSPEVAEEALQEALKAIFERLNQFEGHFDAQFWSWCYRIAGNKASDERRQPWNQRREPLEPEAFWSLVEASAPAAPLAAGERLDLEHAMKLLQTAKPPCYEHLWIHYILGWSYKEMAKAYQISYDAAKVTVRRCLQLAQELMAKGD